MSDVLTSTMPAAKPRRFKVASQKPSGRAGNSARVIRGLGPMTRVATSFGDFPAQALRKNDRVLTPGGNYVPIKAIHRITFDSEYLGYHPGAQPIVICAGAFGQGMPSADIVLAPFHRLDSRQTFISPDADMAIDAIHRPHVYRKVENMITYTLIDCGRPMSVRCEGLWVNAAA